MLKELPTQFEILIDKREEIYILFAIINYKGPRCTRRTSNQGLGHFTTICLRQNKTWIEYDDLREKEEKKSDTYKTDPQLLIYILNKL